MSRIQWDFHRQSISEFYRLHFRVTQKSKQEISVYHFLRNWCNVQSKRARLFIVSTTTAHWYGFHYIISVLVHCSFMHCIIFFNEISIFIDRISSSSSAKSQGHVYYHVAYYSVYIFRNRIWCLA